MSPPRPSSEMRLPPPPPPPASACDEFSKSLTPPRESTSPGADYSHLGHVEMAQTSPLSQEEEQGNRVSIFEKKMYGLGPAAESMRFDGESLHLKIHLTPPCCKSSHGALPYRFNSFSPFHRLVTAVPNCTRQRFSSSKSINQYRAS